MVDNSIDINKTNNHLSIWLTELKKKKRNTMTQAVRNPGPGYKYMIEWRSREHNINTFQIQKNIRYRKEILW